MGVVGLKVGAGGLQIKAYEGRQKNDLAHLRGGRQNSDLAQLKVVDMEPGGVKCAW